MNYGWCLSYQHDSFQLKQDQALGFIGPMQIQDTNDQLSSIRDNQRDVGAIHHFFYQLHAMLSFFVSCPLENNHCNLGIIERYQHTFAKQLLFFVASSLHVLSFNLYCDTHLWGICVFRQTDFYTKCNYQGMHVFFGTPYVQDIISYLPRTDFWVTCSIQEEYSSITQAIQ